jgi:NADH dehydrogenase [ubiquinone] 1 alpha subcomplex assembly factor 6
MNLLGLFKRPVVWRPVTKVRHISHDNGFDKYCFDTVKTHNYEGFLSGILLPKQHRGAYFAIQAFNVEIATIKDQIPRNSAQAGRIRFQFWKDVFQQIYIDKKLSLSNNQPVAMALSHYIPKHDLTLRWFERALEVR